MRAHRIACPAVVLAVALALTLTACSGAPTSTAPPGAGTTATGTIVSMKGLAFDPVQVDIAPGDSVTFVNNDTVPHDLAGGSWKSGTIAPGASYTQKFSAAGTDPVRCTIHPAMTMTVNVK